MFTAVLIGGALLAASPVAAAPVPGGNYMALSDKLDAITLTLNANGSAVQTFSISYPASTIKPGCPSGGNYNAATAPFTLPIANSSFDTGSLQSGAEYAWFKGTFGNDGLVTGEFRADPTVSDACTHRDMKWAGVARTGTTTPVASATYSGTASTNGTVSFTTSANGQSVTGFTLTPGQSCATVTTPTVTLADGVGAWFRTDLAGATVARLRLAVTGNQASGIYAIDQGVASCPPVIGTFIARVGGLATATPTAGASATPSATGTPSATPAAGAGSGAIISGTVPASGGFGLIVYGGGTVAQLVTATKCPTASMALYIAQGGDFLTYVPGTSIGAVNQAFLAAFPNGSVPANTPLIGRCV